MLSKPEIYQRLANHFVGLRFDWEQGNHYRDRFGFILGTGDQLLLSAEGNLIPPAKKGARVYGRNGCDTTPEVLDAVITNRAANGAPRMDWFWWPSKPSRRSGGTYPPPYSAIASYARLPLAFVDGPLPAALDNPDFLRWHVRQFIWVRGKSDAPARIRIARAQDGLKPGARTELAVLDPAALSLDALGKGLDQAWLAYMKERPLVARGYLENPHGGWMRSVKDQMLSEEEQIRERARAGTLLPPGRRPNERPPYQH